MSRRERISLNLALLRLPVVPRLAEMLSLPRDEEEEGVLMRGGASKRARVMAALLDADELVVENDATLPVDDEEVPGLVGREGIEADMDRRGVAPRVVIFGDGSGSRS